MARAGYLIYHPKRQMYRFGTQVVYADRKTGNQDPYVWNDSFLHTFCHMTQMSPEIGYVNFWVSGDRWPDFTKLFCDLVFVVKEKLFWKQPNSIDPKDPIVDSEDSLR